MILYYLKLYQVFIKYGNILYIPLHSKFRVDYTFFDDDHIDKTFLYNVKGIMLGKSDNRSFSTFNIDQLQVDKNIMDFIMTEINRY
jgi:hypothetical protein